MSENRVIRRIFGPKRVEESDSWRKMCNEELQKMYTFCRILCDHIKEDAMGETGSSDGRDDQYILNFSHEAVGRRSVRKVRNKRLGNVKVDLGVRSYEDVDWIHQAKNRDKR